MTVAPSRDSRIQSPGVRGPIGMRSNAQTAPHIATMTITKDVTGRFCSVPWARMLSHARTIMPTVLSAVTRAIWFQKRRATAGTPGVPATRRSHTAARVRAKIPGIRPSTCGPWGARRFATNHAVAAAVSRTAAYSTRRAGSRLASPVVVIGPPCPPLRRPNPLPVSSVAEAGRVEHQRWRKRRAGPYRIDPRPERIRSHHRPTEHGHPPNGQDLTPMEHMMQQIRHPIFDVQDMKQPR